MTQTENNMTAQRKEVATRPDTNIVTPMDMVQGAMDKGLTGEDLQKMMDLADRWETNEARKAFDRAMAEFKKNPPEITKDRTVSFSGTNYKHASHAQVNEVIGKALSEHGIVHRFEMEQMDDGRVKVTCVLTHEAGHQARVSLASMPDDSGKKNSIQAIGSAVTYLQRYTLQAATGIAAKDLDDLDGRPTPPVETITEEQGADLAALIEEVGADKPKFLQWLQVDALENLPAKHYKQAVAALEKKRK